MATQQCFSPDVPTLETGPSRWAVQTTIGVLVSSLVLTATVAGQDWPKAAQRHPGPAWSWKLPFSLHDVFDKDGDGELSVAEIDTAADSLRELDRNQDGVLSAEELRRTVEPPHGTFTGNWIFPGGRTFAEPNFAETLMKSDANGDMRVTREELPTDLHPLFEALDRDENGWISREEAHWLQQCVGVPAEGRALLIQLTRENPKRSEAVQRVLALLKEQDLTESRAAREIAATRRAEWILYSLTVGAMMMAVISFGHLMNFRPPNQGRWRDINLSTEAIHGLLYSLAFISVLSAFDLFWTTSHARHGHFQELNPLGQFFLAEGSSPVLFKVGAVTMSVLLLFSLRRFRGAQIASWWMCFVCTLLTFRWLLLDSSYLS